MLLVGPPGGGKTEVLTAIYPLHDTRPVGTFTEAALLSGTPKREKAADATGGLLREIGDFRILVCKDFGTVLSMHREARGRALAALREIYDGGWTRDVGTDGGRKLPWSGKVGLVGGCTPTIDRHHVVMGAMGETHGSRVGGNRMKLRDDETERDAGRDLRSGVVGTSGFDPQPRHSCSSRSRASSRGCLTRIS